MKKITDFIVDFRNIILVLFTILALICLVISKNVNINYDMSAYLPASSTTKIGNDIMESVFGEYDSSSLNIMFTGLSSDEKGEVLEKIKNIKNVESVDYDETDDYNKDDYTLYIVNVSEPDDSKIATNVYNDVTSEFEDYKYVTSGNISERNKPVLHLWIVIVAIVFAMVILIIMCESYIEPFLFLFSIGLAVFMNKGTNIMFSSVSFITEAIAAILQLALSMDYSIMLMNRYSQERVKDDNKVRAMKKALASAFASISSSSVTTIVGLLALVFMSFTIGRDLGYVLAKGVLFSLLSIFLTLPAEILLFDKLILKTKKKSLNIKLTFLGKATYKTRFASLFIFIVLFGVSFFLKNGVSILYTGSENDEIEQVFKENNQIAIIYKNEYEDKVAEFCKSLDEENNEKISSILCYGNTIGEKLKYNEVNDKLSSLDVNTEIDDYLLKIIYYNYYSKDNNKMTYNEFVNFINNTVIKNKDISSSIDKSTKDNINKLKNFTDKNNINKKRSIKEMSDILDISEDDVNSLYILYNSKNINTKISLTDFINFLNKDVITNKTYSSQVSSDVKTKLATLTPFVNKNIINKDMTSTELNKLFNLGEENIDKLMLLYYLNNDTNEKLSLVDFVNSTIILKNNTNYLDGVDLSLLTSLSDLANNKNNMNETKLNKMTLKYALNNIDNNLSSLVDTVYYMSGLSDDYTLSIHEYINLILNNFDSALTTDQKKNISLLKFVMDEAINKNTYSATELSNILGIDYSKMVNLYTLILSMNNYEFKLSPNNLINVILANKDSEALSSSLTSDNIKTLTLLQTICTSVNNNTKYSANDMSKLLGVNINKVKLLYSLYSSKYINKNTKISLIDFTNFLLNDVITSSEYSAKFNDNSVKRLKNVNKVMTSSLKNEKLSSSAIYTILSSLNDDLDSNLVDLVFIYNGSVNAYNEDWQMTIEEIINYLNNDIVSDKKFKDFIDKDMKNKINDGYTKINDAKKLLVGDEYSRAVINTKYDAEGDETFAFVESVINEFKDDKVYVIGNSPMALDMSKSFNDEMNFITILTMLAIFVVVMFTFKSIIIPAILVLVIQCAVYITMSYLSLVHTDVYFISLLIVQSILMGATIDYAIVYTSYYKEFRLKGIDIKNSIIDAYNNSIHTILTSSSILIIVTLIVGNFASAIAAKICMTISKGTFVSVLLILLTLPSLLAIFDRFVCKELYKK